VSDAVGNVSAGKTATAMTAPLLAVTPLDAWTTIATSAPNNARATVGAGSLTVSAATDRMFLAGVCLETAANATLTTMNVSLGGQNLTQVATTGATSGRSHCYVGRLMETALSGLTFPASLSVTYATSGANVTGLDIKWASYYGVHQAVPVNASNAVYSASTSVTFGTPIDYTLGGLTLYVTENGGSGATHTPPSGFTSYAGTSGPHSSFAADTASHTGPGSYAAGTTVSFGGTTSAWSAVAVASFNRTSCVEPGTVAVTEPIPNPIISALAISATVTGGALNPEVSPDNTNWYTSPWVYDPPIGTTGSVTFYARAEGACGGTITDATPVATTFDTTAAYSISTCSQCHLSPPMDGARSTTTRAAVGSHNVHATIEAMPCADCHVDNTGNLGHLNLDIEMVAGSTGVVGGYYDKNNNGAYNAGTDNTFAMSDSPVLGTCRNTDCHYTNSPTWGTPTTFTCTSCHGYPPTGGTTGINHPGTLQTAMANHDDCVVCHMTRSNGSDQHVPYGTYSEAVNHINGSIEMNSTVGYNQTNFGCDAACHANDAGHRLSDSGLTVNPMVGPSGGCNGCHGYPPTTDAGVNDKHVAGATPVNHTAAVVSNHDDCKICHGTKDNGSNGHDADPAYDVQTKHNQGGITMNSGTQYNATNFGCDAACHANNAAHQMTDSALTVDYYSGAVGDCLACHGTYPPNTNAHLLHATNIRAEPSPPAENPNSTSWTAATHPLCARCHDMSLPGNHQDATDYILPPTYDNGGPSAYEPDFTCSNVNCHFGQSPAWK